jgi:hypothetical protein
VRTRIRQHLELMNPSPSPTSVPHMIAPDTIDIPARIKVLAEPKEADIITQDESETKKKENS